MKHLLLSIFLTTWISSVVAQDFEYEYLGNTLTYSIIDETEKTCKITSCNPNSISEDLSIPSVANGYSVVEIVSGALADCVNLTSTTISNSILFIAEGAFNNCNLLEDVEISDGLSEIRIERDNFNTIRFLYLGRNFVSDYYPFAFNPNLESVSFGGGCSRINAHSFERCSTLSKISIPESIYTVEQAAFSDCTNLKSIRIEDSEEYIQLDSPFEHSNVESLYLGRTFRYKYQSPFEDMSLLTDLTFGDNITSIPQCAFQYCTSLTSLNLPPNIKTIDWCAFCNCKRLTSLTFPPTLERIGDDAFGSCTALKEIIFEDGDSPIYLYASFAFNGIALGSAYVYVGRPLGTCFQHSNIKEVTLGENITEIPAQAFHYSSLTTIDLSHITKIMKEAFSNCNNLTSIAIPEGMTEIQSMAFYGCENLHEVIIEDGEIPLNFGSNVFDNYGLRKLYLGRVLNPIHASSTPLLSDCYVLSELTIGENVASIDNYLFKGCKWLKQVNFGTGISYIGEGAFAGCDKINSIICSSILPPSVYYNSFEEQVYADAILEIPESSINSYLENTVWRKFLMEYFVPVTEISLVPTQMSIEADQTLQIVASVYPENASIKTLEWTSSNEDIATVNQDGLVTALQQGECIITARATDDSGVVGTCQISATAGVASAFSERGKCTVYDFSGEKILEGRYEDIIRFLSPGLYIIHQNNSVQKLNITK